SRHSLGDATILRHRQLGHRWVVHRSGAAEFLARVDAANLAWCSAWMAADDQYRSGKPTVGRTVEILRLAGPGADAAEYRVFRAIHAFINAGGSHPGVCYPR